jgi:AcrR family transcriptional regulator
MTTKDLILQTARELFNQQGTARVTTNHIAKQADLSPGNLYYHFNDKDHIIKEIYENMIRDWEGAYNPIEGQEMHINALRNFIGDNFEMLWQYRFFYREMVALLNNNPALAKRHIEISQKRFLRQHNLLQKAVQDGLLQFPTYAIQQDIVTMAWLIANHYLVHLESMGQQVEKADFEKGIDLVMLVFSPYLR